MYKRRLLCLFLYLIIYWALPASITWARDSRPDTSIRHQDTMAVKLEKTRAVVNRVNTGTKNISQPKKVRLAVSGVKKKLLPIQNDLKNSKKTVDTKTLTRYQSLLKKSQDQLGTYRQTLSKSAASLQSGAKILTKFNKDSVLAVSKKDSAANPAYVAQMLAMNKRLQLASRSVDAGLDTVNRLLSEVSSAYLAVADVQE